MYTQHFALSEPPFSIAPNPRYLYLSPKHREALAHLLYGISVGGGFVVLSGEVGMGKTTLCRALLDQLPEDVELALIFNPRLNSRELLAGICDELHIAYQGPKASLKQLIDALNRYLLDAHAAGRRIIVLIDEAQNLRFDVLEQIRLLTNLETDQAKLLQIILVGQPELNQVLDRPNLRQLSQRITARFHLLPLSLEETRDYLAHRLRVGGVSDPLFSGAAVKAIYQRSKGIPRLINLIADRSLLGAYALGRHRVDGSLAKRAGLELLGKGVKAKKRWPKAFLSMILISLFGLLSIVVLAPQWGFSEKLKDFLKEHPLTIKDPVDAPRSPSEIKEERPATTAPVPDVSGDPPVMSGDDFAGWMTTAGLGRHEALLTLLMRWHVTVPKTTSDPCASMRPLELRCQPLQIAWQQLLQLNLPAVLEFSRNDGSRRFLLLSGISDGQPVFTDDHLTRTFDVAEVLTRWTGRATLVWKPPVKAQTSLKPLMSSPLVPWIRQQLGVIGGPGQEMIYDEALVQKVKAFQRELELRPDGIIGVLTLMGMAGHGQDAEVPRLIQTDSKGQGG